MPVSSLAAAGLLLAAAPAFADQVHRSTIGVDRTRCTVQQVHTPAGKLVHNAPIVRCRTVTAIAAADVRPPRPARSTARP